MAFHFHFFICLNVRKRMLMILTNHFGPSQPLVCVAANAQTNWQEGMPVFLESYRVVYGYR